MLRDEHGRTPIVIDVADSEYTGAGRSARRRTNTKRCSARTRRWRSSTARSDEWDAIAVSYTSGTTGDPKGVVTHHRGAYLNAVCNAATWTMPHFPVVPLDLADVPLQRLVLSVDGGACSAAPTCACARSMQASHPSSMRCASTVSTTTAPRRSCTTLLIAAHGRALRAGITQKVRGMVAGAAPPAAMIEGMAKLGFDITHVYGLTEVYGPASVAVKRNELGRRRACRSRPV